MRRTKAEAAQTREEIFKAGLRVFSEKGFAAATMADVATAAGTTRGAIYWHFSSKGEFFREIVGRLSNHYDEVIRDAVTKGGASPELIRRAVRSLLYRFQKDSEWRAMQELVIRANLNGNPEGDVKDELADETTAKEMLRRAIGAGELYDRWEPETALFCLSGAVSGFFLYIAQSETLLSDAQIEAVAEFVARGFSPRVEEE